MKLAVRYGKGAESKHVQARRRAGRLGGAAQGAGARRRRVQGSALHQPGRRRAIGAGDPDADQGSLHRRVRSGEPRARRVHQGAQGTADAAGEPGGGRDRQRPAVRRGAAQRGADREGAALRAARAGGAAAHGAAEGARAASTWPAASSRRASSEATCTIFSCPKPNTLVVAVGDVSGKGAPAALYGAFAAELVRSRTLRRRFTPDRFSVAGVLQAMNTILHERQLEEYYCTLCYAFFDFRRRVVDAVELGSAVSDSLLSGASARQIELPGVPLGSFPGVTYDEVTLALQPRRPVRVLHRRHLRGAESEGHGVRRDGGSVKSSARTREGSARGIVDAIFDAVTAFTRRASRRPTT